MSVYEQVRSFGTYNVFGARIRLDSTLNVENWRLLSTNHIDDDWLIQLVEYGFPLQYVGPSCPTDLKKVTNHSSAVEFQDHVSHFIQKEIENNTIFGPFHDIPFEWGAIAPMMTRPKSNPQKRRIIVDFSYPNGGINASIHKNIVFGQYVDHWLPTVEQALKLIRQKQFRVNLATIDLERAYRNFRVDPIDWPLTCVTNQRNVYIDTAVPFGSRLSSLYMQKAAQFIQRALHARGITILVYLDDGLLITPDDCDADAQLLEVTRVIRELGLPLAYDKMQTPAKICTFLGIRIDLNKRVIEIPQSKIECFLQQIEDVLAHDTISRQKLQSIIGSVNHLSKAVQGARLFMNRLLDCLRGMVGNTTHVGKEIHDDLNWFRVFLRDFNGRAIINDGIPRTTVEADSCLIGGGGHNGSHAYMYKYPAAVRSSFHISQLEALNCLIAIRALLDDSHNNSVVQVNCDNQAVVSSIQSSRGKDRVINSIARALWFIGARRNIEFRFVHIPGVQLHKADALSRAFVDADSWDRAQKVMKDNSFKKITVYPFMHNFNKYF